MILEVKCIHVFQTYWNSQNFDTNFCFLLKPKIPIDIKSQVRVKYTEARREIESISLCKETQRARAKLSCLKNWMHLLVAYRLLQFFSLTTTPSCFLKLFQVVSHATDTLIEGLIEGLQCIISFLLNSDNSFLEIYVKTFFRMRIKLHVTNL